MNKRAHDEHIQPAKKIKDNFLELVKNSANNDLQINAYLENKRKEEEQYKKFVEYAESVILKSQEFPDQSCYVECEARIGRDLKNFISDIGISHFESVLKFMNNDAIKEHFVYNGLFESVDFIFREPDDSQDFATYRLTCLLDEHDKALNPISYIRKNKLDELNSKIFIPSYSSSSGRNTEYFSRISLSEELSLQIPDELRIPEKAPWHAKRVKRRYSWTSTKYPWRLDMSKVDMIFKNAYHNRNSKNHNDATRFTNEIEIELVEKNFDNLLHGINFIIYILNKFVSLEQSNLSLVLNDNDVQMAFKKLYSTEETPTSAPSNFGLKDLSKSKTSNTATTNVLKNNSSCEFMPGFFSDSIAVVNDPRSLADIVMMLTNQKNFTFPGSMPVSLTKQKLYSIESSQYYISEKTDGVRFFLLICSQGVYLINRSFVFFKVLEYSSGVSSIVNLYSSSTTSSLFDGEMVVHYKTQKLYFLIFDCISYKGKDYSNFKTADRLKPIGEFIELYRKNIQNWENTHPFYFLGKLMVRLNTDSLKKLDSQMKYHKNSGDFVFDDNNKRCHLLDGLIFTPSNEPYVYRSSRNLYKWKYYDKLTVDYELRIDETMTTAFYLRGNNNTNVLVKKEVLEPRDTQAILAASAPNVPLIAEMEFDTNLGIWRLKLIRIDKDKANHVSVAFSTMECMCEKIDMDLIHKTISALEKNA